MSVRTARRLIATLDAEHALHAVTGPEEGLNVEWLAQALWAWGFDATGPVIRDDVKEPTEGQRRMARKLAIEYDRLRALGDSR
jgi:hypothetical protein